MKKNKVFTFRVSADDMKMIDLLAEYHHRSRSDAVRMLLQKAGRDLSKKSQIENVTQEGETHDRPITKG